MRGSFCDKGILPRGYRVAANLTRIVAKADPCATGARENTPPARPDRVVLMRLPWSFKLRHTA